MCVPRKQCLSRVAHSHTSTAAAAKRAREEEDARVQGGAFNAVAFAYGNAEAAAEPALPPPPPLERYVPPFALPAHLSTANLPLTVRDGAVISRTAAYVRSSGPQSEIVLRVRHADNSRFDFLHAHHPWHPFYRYLVTHDPEATVKSAQQSLALLTSAYGDDDAEGEPAVVEASAPPVAEGPGCTAAPPGEAAPPPAELPACVDADEAVAPHAPAADPSQPSAEVLTVMDKLIGFVVKDGPAFEAVTRKRQATNPNFAFLHPWSPLNVVYLRRLAAARGETLPGDDGGVPAGGTAGVAAAVVEAVAAAGQAPRKRRRWDVAPVSSPGATDADTPPAEHIIAASNPNTEEEARKAERLRRAREFSAQRAAAVQASVVSAHVSLTSSHRAALLAGDGGDDLDDPLLPPPHHDVAPPHWHPPKLTAPAAAPARSLADAHADRLSAAVRATKTRGEPPRGAHMLD